ncbi:unnamed protein product [Didymodactylos carnosus]|uniref:FAD-binding PCMH-type domain-containing protein n=1 Tax=Didymodactylos carnosus TaxID=1234261 RepID=A0A815K4V6_9BILA|nr:unnamed protein product [Didymodactylos carnosus]CAF1388064.1 unnamed protein product [Didymodactylos carnosus]CAF4070911.1 unnamed protein product [Didymodactylos carnosus]CAF4282868.1 unnamed protein product [Didymodactylos carnosus]
MVLKILLLVVVTWYRIQITQSMFIPSTIASNTTSNKTGRKFGGSGQYPIQGGYISPSPDMIDDVVYGVSVGGGRYSQGGQTALTDGIHIDLRQFNQILGFEKKKKEIRVETGCRWSKIIEFIDKYDLSVMVMQSYADFTVGGALSVNVHGRYIGYGSISRTVKELKLLLANGDLVTATPDNGSSEIFFGTIGGYGGLGVVVEVTLQLTDNCKLERVSRVMQLRKYEEYFEKEIRRNHLVQLHNANIQLLSHATSMWQKIP